jgi:hypothetical protein
MKEMKRNTETGKDAYFEDLELASLVEHALHPVVASFLR